MNKYLINIGIEIHLELKTKTKMFSSAPNNFGHEPNTHVNQVDLGYPGTLPQVNAKAVEFGILMAKSFKMKVDSLVRFDRKHYFYPDLPKGYQITQQRFPIGKDGEVSFFQDEKIKTIKLERIHLEEDTATQIHKDEYSYLNFNRCGVPLIEIVSTPTITSADTAVKYIEAIRNVALFLGISDAKLEAGSLRADLNISIRKSANDPLGTKVEIKNLNSLSNLRKAIKFEYNFQENLLDNNQQVESWTKRFDEKTQTTINMRNKNTVIDYCYMPEPNIAPIQLGQDFLNNVVVPELPTEKYNRYLSLNIRQKTIEKLVNNQELSAFFDKVNYKNYQKTADVLFAEVVSLMNKTKKQLKDLFLTPEDLNLLLTKLEKNAISGKQLKKMVKECCLEKTDLKKLLSSTSNELINDKTILKGHITSIINTIKEIDNLYIKNPTKVQRMLVGNLMKATKGKANPKIAMEIINQIFKNETMS